MTRVFLTIVLPVLLPSALYLLWAMSVGRAGTDTSAAAWRARGYTRWPGVAGDRHDVLAPGAPYP